MEHQERILTRNWDLYDTRNVVYRTTRLTAAELKNGYDWAYREFYCWNNIFRASMNHDTARHFLKHLFYAGGWKKFEAVWNFMIKTRNLGIMLPILEAVLSKVKLTGSAKTESPVVLRQITQQQNRLPEPI
jgi:hypothetical protein